MSGKQRCSKECFANYNGYCFALTESYIGECPFQRTDITWMGQHEDILMYERGINDKRGSQTGVKAD